MKSKVNRQLDDIAFEPTSLIIKEKERTNISPITLDRKKRCIRLHYIDEGIAKNWIVQADEILEIMYTNIPCRQLWCAVRLFDIISIHENPFQLYFSISRHNVIIDFNLILKTLKSMFKSTKFTSVCPPTFCNRHPNVEDFLIYDVIYHDSDMFKLAEPVIDINLEVKEEEIRKPIQENSENIIVKYSNGSTETISHQLLISSLEPTGWLCNSLIDIMVKYFELERLSEATYATWKDKVLFYDSFFFQKLIRFNDALQAVSFENYKQIMQLMYPIKNGIHKNVPQFEKELIVIPVICKKHWFLILLHKPMDAALDDRTEYLLDNENQKKRCRIIIIDSKSGYEDVRFVNRDKLSHIHDIIFNCIKNWVYLMIYHHGEFANLQRGCLKIECEKIPMQPNDDDCGIFLLMFIEEFVLNNWSWTDWPHSSLKDLSVKDDKSFRERTLVYRDFISEVVLKQAINIPSMTR